MNTYTARQSVQAAYKAVTGRTAKTRAVYDNGERTVVEATDGGQAVWYVCADNQPPQPALAFNGRWQALTPAFAEMVKHMPTSIGQTSLRDAVAAAVIKHGDGDQSPHGHRFMHGTRASVVDSILQKGITAHVQETNWGYNDDLNGHVFFTTDEGAAMEFAICSLGRTDDARQDPNRKIAIFEVEIPESEQASVVPDKRLTFGDETPTSFARKDNIPPEWIVGYKVYQTPSLTAEEEEAAAWMWKPWDLVNEERLRKGKVVFVPIILPGQLAKHKPGGKDHDQSTHGHETGAGRQWRKASWQGEKRYPSGQKITLIKGDLTTQPVDAIVNAANENLQHGGGLAGVIVQRGGRVIQDESDAWRRQFGLVTHDRPAVTGAGGLPAQKIIHAVAPIWSKTDPVGDYDKLRTAYQSALETADALELRSVAFASLGTGIFGIPIEIGAEAARSAVDDFVAANPKSTIKDIRFVIWDKKTLDKFKSVVED